MPLGEFLFEYLYRCGVRHSFGLPGDFALSTYAWLEKSKISSITMTHEPGAGFAADAYARANGLGLVCVTYCVGGLNVLNAIAGAYAEKSPVVVVSGAPGRAVRGSRSSARAFGLSMFVKQTNPRSSTPLSKSIRASDPSASMVATVMADGSLISASIAS